MRFVIVAGLMCAALGACASGGSSSSGANREPIRALVSGDGMMFVSFDTDGDLRTSLAEIEAGIIREFARADSNHDNSLQPIEYESWSTAVLGGGQMGPYRLDFDRNVDNGITAEEWRNELSARARDYDGDEDGVLTRAELVRLIDRARPVAPTRRVVRSM